ncbi:cytochrome c oxidase assembly protein [Actinomadura meridiana]|uniref:Cytochrome c oxidase assembly protein n=1 Tax=Actinomadura meridiana TaxID=559626 RepID=A0ABP8CK55_9ACTN
MIASTPPPMPGMDTMHMSGPMWMPTAPPTLERLLAWHPQPLPLEPAVCLVALTAYALAVVRLHRRGDRWPPLRTAAWIAGVATGSAVTCTGVGGYGMELFSVHMVQHMVLSMLTPVLLLLGAPLTLALRALPAGRGRAVPRELLVGLLHSRFTRIISSPLFTLPLFIASLYGLYFTPLFDLAMRSWLGHEIMLVHFVAVGLLFFWPIVGADPAPHRPPHPLRMLELFIGMPFHAFFGIAVMMSTTPVAAFFAHPPASWGMDAVSDQTTGGGIAWAFGEVPTMLVLAALFAQWFRDDTRRAARADRQADRDQGTELARYNAYLSRLSASDSRDR